MTLPGFSFDPRFERASHPAFVIDPLDDRFVAANPAGCDLLGYTREELLETPVSRIHPGELTQLQALVRNVLHRGHGSTITLTCRIRQGNRLPIELALWAFEHDDRILILGLVDDRSEHRGAAGATEPRLSARTETVVNVAARNPARKGALAMVTAGLIVRLEAKPGKERQLASFLAAALPLVRDEPETVAWFALRTDGSSFAIVDAFPDEAGRQAHLGGAVAAALVEHAAELLATPPEIEQVDVLAAKLPEGARP